MSYGTPPRSMWRLSFQWTVGPLNVIIKFSRWAAIPWHSNYHKGFLFGDLCRIHQSELFLQKQCSISGEPPSPFDMVFRNRRLFLTISSKISNQWAWREAKEDRKTKTGKALYEGRNKIVLFLLKLCLLIWCPRDSCTYVSNWRWMLAKVNTQFIF